MRLVAVQLLTHDKQVTWYHIPWGKKYLDDLRKKGHILQTQVYYE